RRRPGSRTASACAGSWRKSGARTATSRTRPEVSGLRSQGFPPTLAGPEPRRGRSPCRRWAVRPRRSQPRPTPADQPVSATSPTRPATSAGPAADSSPEPWPCRCAGRFVAETLVEPRRELAAAYDAARADPGFIEALDADLRDYVGRPSPVYFAERLSRENGGARILLKREDLNHTGAHKINNTV